MNKKFLLISGIIIALFAQPGRISANETVQKIQKERRNGLIVLSGIGLYHAFKRFGDLLGVHVNHGYYVVTRDTSYAERLGRFNRFATPAFLAKH